MKQLSFFRGTSWLAICLFVAVLWREPSFAADALKIQTQLIWGTNEQQAPDAKHKPIDDALAKKLRSAYRWTNYFEINRQVASIPAGGTNNISMSDRCKLEVKNLGGDRIEVKLYGKGKLVSTHKESVAVNWPLILSGNASNNTAWFVVIKKVDPTAAKPMPAPAAPAGEPAK